MWTPVQLALLREAGIAGNSLSAGLASLRKANYAHPGLYSNAFFNLSIGLERFLKILYIMDYLIETNGARFPTDKELRKIGHDIEALFHIVSGIRKKHKINAGPTRVDAESIEMRIIIFLSRFAKTSRYYNLDFLSGAIREGDTVDPIAEWFSKIGGPILEKHFKSRQKSKVTRNAEIVNNLFGVVIHVDHTAEDGSPLDNPFDASFQTGMTEVIRKYGTFYSARICRYLYYILYEMRHICHDKSIAVPYLDELFFPFMNDDAYLLSRKTFPPRGQGA